MNARDLRYAVGLDNTVDLLIADARKKARAEAFEEVARIMDLHRDKVITGAFLAWAIRTLKGDVQ